MIVGSIKEDLASEKRVSLTPETAKNIIGLGLKVCIEKEYAIHLGIKDNEYEKVGVEIKSSPSEVSILSNLIIKVNCPSESEISILKENSTMTFKYVDLLSLFHSIFHSELQLCCRTSVLCVLCIYIGI